MVFVPSQPSQTAVNRYAFVIHPLSLEHIHKHPAFGWTQRMPDNILESIAAWVPPLYISRITGGQSPTSGQRIEGFLYTLGTTPGQMMRRSERFTYKRLACAVNMAKRQGARIMGLGAFTSVVGDAGITVAKEAEIAITSGNSLTAYTTLEASKRAVHWMGLEEFRWAKAMVVGATGSIGSVCSRLLAKEVSEVALISKDAEKLSELKHLIQRESADSSVIIATNPDDLIGRCNLIITATSALETRIIDISRCLPGAVICDVAQPPDISLSQAALRPDVLVIESGEVVVPGDINWGYDIGLPQNTAYACLAETVLLAMEGLYEDYSVGRNITPEQVLGIVRLFRKHNFQLAELRSYGRIVTDEQVAYKRQLAGMLRKDLAIPRGDSRKGYDKTYQERVYGG